MNSLKLSAVLVSIAAIGTAAIADSPVGTWKGHLDMKMPDISKVPPQMMSQVKSQLDMVKKMVFLLKINKDKSFTMDVQGLPAGMGDAKDAKQEGSWTQAGNAVTLKSKAKPGKPDSGKPVTMTMAGKSMTLVPPGAGGQGKITFVKG